MLVTFRHKNGKEEQMHERFANILVLAEAGEILKPKVVTPQNNRAMTPEKVTSAPKTPKNPPRKSQTYQTKKIPTEGAA